MMLPFLFLVSTALAAGAQLTVAPSSTEIVEDENLSLEFKTSIDELRADIGRPAYEAPDFDEVNAYAGMSGMESTIINGVISVKRTHEVTVVLHPRKTGKLAVRGIHVIVNGKKVTAPDLEVTVHPAGSTLAGRGGGTVNPFLQAPQRQLPGAGVRPPAQQAAGFFLKTEPSKLRAYKGEQIILTYAIYTRVQIYGVQVERYPTVPGFLKEDMDIPLLTMRLNYSPAVVGGQEYSRAVLAQYAVYPMKEGTQTIDALTGKFSFRANPRIGGDTDDPFGMLNQFFRAMQTATESRSSDRVSVEVLPLPAEGQPAGFSGLVGDFDITAVADKLSAKTGEAINVKVKVSGKGHAGGLERLSVAWPADFELYEDKSTTNFMRTGYSDRLFDYMVIPRSKGTHQIPSIELSMFNPETKSYQVRRTEPIQIQVLEGPPGSVYVGKPKADAPPGAKEDIRYWMASPPVQARELSGKAAGVAVVGSLLFAAFSLYSLARPSEEQLRQQRTKTGRAFLDQARALAGRDVERLRQHQGEKDSSALLARAENFIFQLVDFQYGVKIGSLTRAEVRDALSQKGVDPGVTQALESLLERCENIRFAPGGADFSSAQTLTRELVQVVERIYSKQSSQS